MLCDNEQLTLNSAVSTILLKCELAPSAGNHSSTEEFASSEDNCGTQQNLFPPASTEVASSVPEMEVQRWSSFHV